MSIILIKVSCECSSLLMVNRIIRVNLCSVIVILLQKGLAVDCFDRATMFCEAFDLESGLAYIRTFFSNRHMYFLIRTAAEKMHFSPVYPVNADEQKADLLSCHLPLRFLGVMNPIVY